MADRETVDFWFDPICPWAWMTSRWIKEVEQVRDIDVRWHPFSLSHLNAGHDIPEEYREGLDSSWPTVRLAAAAQAHGGDDALDRYYTAIGTLIHPGERDRHDRNTLVQALADADLPADLIAAADSTDLDDDIKASTDRALALVGDDVGVPVISVQGVSFFGPVVAPAPKGEAAGRLWDGCVLVAGTDGFFEIKRSRDRSPSFD